MNVYRPIQKACMTLVAMALLAGCQTVADPGLHEPAVTPLTKQSYDLRTLPAPERRVPVAVYDFPDLTGQYKERDTVQSLSRAVTQGGAPMLIKALQDAGERQWFSVLDRARLDDILKERQIVTEMRRIYRSEQRVEANVLPPLAHAGIILQGGITGYDTNVHTGGIGVRYLGIGPNARWQRDSVTVTLRAVSTNSGEVLASVTVSKDIASVSLQGGSFSFIALDKILETEAGVTKNEPKQLAVQQAIEKAVVALIVEGSEIGVWSFADKRVGQKVVLDYRGEKYGDAKVVAGLPVTKPATQNPAAVVETLPVRATSRPSVHRPSPAGPVVPNAEDDKLPPAADDGEVIGSTGVNTMPKVEAVRRVDFPGGDDQHASAGRLLNMQYFYLDEFVVSSGDRRHVVDRFIKV